MWGVDVHRVRTLFLRCVCLTYAVAFHSLYTQVSTILNSVLADQNFFQLPGLYGDHGLLPARASLPRHSSLSLSSSLLSSPTLLWFLPHTGLSTTMAMDLLCLFGTSLGLACALFPSLATVLSLFLLHISYLSLLTVGGTFMHFQWDILLLEAGALAVLAAPVWLGQQDTPLPRVETPLLSIPHLIQWPLVYLFMTGPRLFVVGALAPLPDDVGQRLCEAHLRLPSLVVSHCDANPLLLTGEPLLPTRSNYLPKAPCLSASQHRWLGLLPFSRTGFRNLVLW